MSRSSAHAPAAGISTSNVWRRHVVDIAALPEPPAEFYAADVDVPNDVLRVLHVNHVLSAQKTSHPYETASGDIESSYVNRYTVDPRVYACAVESAETVSTLPCGATGFTNQGDGVYACSHDDARCEATYSRDEIERVFFGGERA